MCFFSGATCTSRVSHNANYVPYAQIRFDLGLRQRVASLTLDCNGVFVIKAYYVFSRLFCTIYCIELRFT